MSVAIVQKLVTYIKEIQEVILFTTMTDARWYFVLGASPLFHIMLPFIGFLLIVNALINGYFLVKASNRNLNRWFNFISSMVSSILSSVSLYGATISVFLGVSFSAGPWLFFSSLIITSVYQITMCFVNLRRAYESLSDSVQRMHYIQATLNNLFFLVLFSLAVAAVFLTLVFPAAAPLAGVCFALGTACFIGINILWRIGPRSWKLAIKEFCNLGKPNLIEENVCKVSQDVRPLSDKEEEENPNHHRLFTCMDYSAKIRIMDAEVAKRYMYQIIRKKIVSYKSIETQKTKDKIAALTETLNALESESKLCKKKILMRHPLVFQSFWTEKGDVEQIIDAVVALQVRFKKTPSPFFLPLLDSDTYSPDLNPSLRTK
jgi:hypothetical protein